MIGARMHYAVPRILAQARQLERFFTDLSATHGWPRLLRLVPRALHPSGFNRLLSRVADGVPAERMKAFNNFGWTYARRRARANNPSTMTQTFLWANRRFGELVCQSDWSRASAVFTFNCAGLEILHRAKEMGLATVMEQTIAPSAIEQRLLQEEHELHPGWEQPLKDDYAAQYSQREQAEWPLADLILCGSEFVRDGIRQCGGPVGKCVVVPYGVDVPENSLESKVQSLESHGQGAVRSFITQPSTFNLQPSIAPRPLRVLTVGAVGLRKGAPYVLEAARRLKGKAQFRWVGAIHLLPEAAAGMAKHVELMGTVPRPAMAAHYQWADVFLLPSICEGSATATYEALAHRLPVICTPNTGSMIRDGTDGLIVLVQNAGGLVTRVEKFAEDAELRSRLADNARNRAAEFTVAAYGQRLFAALGALVANP